MSATKDRDRKAAPVKMKTGPAMRKDLQAIIASRPVDLAGELTSYAIRIRNEAYRVGLNRGAIGFLDGKGIQ